MLFIVISYLVISIYLIATFGLNNIVVSILGAILLIITFIILYEKQEVNKLIVMAENESKKREELLNIQRKVYKALIMEHLLELTTKKQQLVIKESYGLTNTEKWKKEKAEFIEKIIQPTILSHSKSVILSKKDVSKEIEKAIEGNADKSCLDYSDDMDPFDYEHFCAKLLTNNGWVAHATVATGDQGADVIAEKSNKKVILQCKKWSNPVGNKAVQEVFAATSFHNAHKGVVVSNTTYTPSAKQVANKIGVLLIHHNDLAHLESMI